MASIDERVVAMSFENGKFEAGVAQTMATLSKLDSALQNVGKTTGLSNISAEASRINLGGISNAIDSIGTKFSVLAGAASVAFGSIAAQAISAGAQMVKGLTLTPVMEGFHNYETQINAVQTILANTGLTGQKGLDTVSASLNNLNDYANQTVYNFSEMAKNIGTFTAAGVKLNVATDSIKGIANLAALSGSSAQQASTAMYQLSQAIAAGTVHLQDWNSVVNAGMGGQVFQKALFNTAKAMGTLTNVPVGQTFEEWKKAGNSFRQSLSQTAKETVSSVDVVKKAQKDAAKTVSDAQTAAADSIENAARRVNDAQKGQADAAKQASEDVAAAVAAQTETVKRGAEDVKAALDAVREARKRLAEAMKPPSADELQAAGDKLKTAQLDQADLSTAVTDAQREQQRAVEDLATAQKKLADVQKDPKADALALQAAQRAVEDAQKRVTDTADAQTRALLEQRAATRDVDQAEKDLQETRRQGTKKDKDVKDAQDALTEATKKYKDAKIKEQQDTLAAAKHVQDVQVKSNENIAKAGQRLADAEKDQAKTIKDAQQRIADAHTQAAEKIKAARDSISSQKAPQSWLTSDVLTTTLQTFTGDMTDAQLKAKGFTDAQIKNIQAMAKVAVNSATQIKTFSQLTQALREEVGTAWANVFKTLFGDINSARSIFTQFHKFAQDALTGPIIALNKILQDWAHLGGRVKLIEGLKSGMKDLQAILKPLHEAFREVFPAQTGKDLLHFTQQFKELMDKLLIGPETADKLKRTFAGFFALLHIGITIVKDIASGIFHLLGIAGKDGGGGFLTLTAHIGDFLVKLDKAISKGNILEGFFKGLGEVIKVPIALVKDLANAIGRLFGTDTSKAKGVGDSMSNLNEAIKPLSKTLGFIADAWDKVEGIFGRIIDRIPAVLTSVGDAVGHLVSTIASGISNTNFDTVFAAIETTLIGGIFVAIKKGLGNGVNVDFGGGLLKNLAETFKALTGNLVAMQQAVKAATLLEIAAAIGILAAGVAVLASIDAKALNRAMTAVAIGLGELVAAMALLSKFAGGTAFVQLPAIAGSLILIATAVTILAGAMKIFATMKWSEILKGLAGVAGALTAVGVGTALMGPELILIGPGLLAVATATTILAGAVKIFSTMKWEELGKGLLGVAGALTAISIGMVGLGPEILLIGPGLLITAAALTALSVAVLAFGKMDLETIGVGILGIAGSLVAIGFAMQAMPPTLPLIAAGLLLVAPALAAIAVVVGVMGRMKITTLVKGIAALGATLLTLALGLTAMIVAAPGAVALAATAAALTLLVPSLGLLGKMKWGTIFKGLAAIAAILGTLAIAGLVAAPGLLALGAALIPLGIGMAAIAGSIYIFAKAIQVMGDQGSKAVAAVIASLTALVVAMPKIVIDFFKGLVQIAHGIVDLLPQITVALGLVLDTIIAFVVQHAKPFGEAVGALIQAFYTVVRDNGPALIQTGFLMLTQLLQGFAQNAPAVTAQVVAIITGILTTLASAAPQLTEAGANALVAFIGGIASKAPQLVTAVVNLIVKFVGAVASQLGKIGTAAADLMTKFLTTIASFEAKVIAAGAHAILTFFSGIASMIPKVINKGVEIVSALLDGVSKALVRLVNKGADAVINFLNGIAAAIREKGPQLRAAGYNVADAIIDGMIDGVTELGSKIIGKFEELIGHLPKAARKLLGIHSPSVVFQEIGQQTMQGLAGGISDGGDLAVRSVSTVTDKIVSSTKDGLQFASANFGNMTDINPTITPVLDLSLVREQSKDIGPIVGGSISTLDLAPSIGKESQKQASQFQFESLSSTPWGVGVGDVGNKPTPVVQFVQHNTSPKALTAAEIYRLTHNQLASAKGRLFGKVDNIR